MPKLNLGIEVPFISCIVSGGHTFIALAESPGKFRLLSTTVDDSIGETFDKVGRELGITEVPAGKHVEALAKGGNSSRFEITKPQIKARPNDMSFSGVKEFTIKLIKRELANAQENKLSEEEIEILKKDLAASFQEGITSYFMSRLKKNLCKRKDIKDIKYTSIVIAGGVACNSMLRSKMEEFEEKLRTPIKYPPVNLCTDNGVMVAWNGYEKYRSGYVLEPIKHFNKDDKYEVRSRWKMW